MPHRIIDTYYAYLNDRAYPCSGAKAAMGMHQVKCLVAKDLGSDADDTNILSFLYEFIDAYRTAGSVYHSASVIFQQPLTQSEREFDAMMWRRLQALHDLDSRNYRYDERVDDDPHSPDFSFSLKEEAFFIIGMHPGSSRASRRFSAPVLTFNPHDQFEKLRANNKYALLKDSIRKHDVSYSGSVNPMLNDFGKFSEVYQYSGMQYDKGWQCPLIIRHGKSEYNISP